MKEYKLKIKVPSNVQKIHSAFRREGFPLYLVGGAVRDALLGKTPIDFDLTTSALPSEVFAIAEKYGLHTVKDLGNAHGVVTVEGEEIATFRTDIGSGRRPDAVEFTTIDNDVKRRDLTINALYYDLDRGVVIDYVGGVADIRNSKIRTVGDPLDRFAEDAIRKLRAVRFSERMGSKMDKAVYTAIKKDPSLPGVSAEIIRKEFIKGIKTTKSPKAYILMCSELKLLPLILPSMKLRKPTTDSRNFIVQIADMLRGNDIKRVGKLLLNMRYEKKETLQVQFLLEFADFTVDKLTTLKKAEIRCGIPKEFIIEYGTIVKKKKEAIKFANFKLSVRGGDVPADVPKKETGNWIRKAEQDKYLKEESMGRSYPKLRRLIREELSKLNESYFPSAAAAVDAARAAAEKRGFEIDEADWQTQITLGGKYGRLRPNPEEYRTFSVGLFKNGKPQRKNLQITLYMMPSGRIELVHYIL